jgi:SAM-dependent methyltransferase
MMDRQELDRQDKDLGDYFSGRKLYGDDLDLAGRQQWFEDERYGYFEMAKQRPQSYRYVYDELNIFHAFRHLSGRRFKQCLAFGCARGDEVMPIVGQVERFLAVEPAEQWWSESIGGVPATYIKPNEDGSIPCDDGSCDIATCFGVLHHIPNVSDVIGEIARVLAPGGLFLLREPIHTMGDWRRPRRGLTRHERGLPLEWLDETVRRNHLSVQRRALCMFHPAVRVSRMLGVSAPYNSAAYVYADAAISAAMSWNVQYHRHDVIHRMAPSCVFLVLRKLEEPSS